MMTRFLQASLPLLFGVYVTPYLGMLTLFEWTVLAYLAVIACVIPQAP